MIVHTNRITMNFDTNFTYDYKEDFLYSLKLLKLKFTGQTEYTIITGHKVET